MNEGVIACARVTPITVWVASKNESQNNRKSIGFELISGKFGTLEAEKITLISGHFSAFYVITLL